VVPPALRGVSVSVVLCIYNCNYDLNLNLKRERKGKERSGIVYCKFEGGGGKRVVKMKMDAGEMGEVK
jgi:hypothetical protein